VCERERERERRRLLFLSSLKKSADISFGREREGGAPLFFLSH